ncbi:MAG: TetR family transcriptional regulator [Spirochaetales bacterium]|nr:TetR family transcriptional regulator [Spirochaetales bacterium]
MPPKEKYNKEIILETALEIARAEGLEKVSVRNIASKIGCSTQPIYSSFDSVTELEKELIIKIKTYAQKKILEHEENDEHEKFLAIGMGYFLFSKTEPQLFNALFTKNKWEWSFSAEDPFFKPILEKMKTDNALKEMDNKILLDLFRDMLIYTHGLATRAYLDNSEMTEEQARALLKRMGAILIVSTITKSYEEIENIMRSYHKCTD